MSEKKNMLLKITLLIFAIVTIAYGVNYLFFPDFQIKMSGGEPIEPGWIRWFGGVLIALGYGSYMAFRNPAKQGILVSALCIGTLLVGLALLYEVIFMWDSSYNMMNTAIPAIIQLLFAILFWIGLRRSKEILW